MNDDTQHLQRYLDAIADPNHRNRMPLESKTYRVTDTLRIARVMGLGLRGAGGQNRSLSSGWDGHRACTILQWDGPSDKPMLELVGCTGLVMDGINLNAANAAAAIRVRDDWGSLNFHFANMGIIGGNVGIDWGGSFQEHTCANALYSNVWFQLQDEACVRLNNNQSLVHQFVQSFFAFTPIAIDVAGGGDVSVTGGGTYELGTLLRLGRVGSNTAGFDIRSVRFDGSRTRTCWLDAVDTDQARTYGTVTYDNCTQNNGQRESDLPLFRVPPGCRCVARACSFRGLKRNWAEVYSEAGREVGGEFIAEYCDGIYVDQLPTLVMAKGSKAYYEFLRCGDLYHRTGSYSTFPS